MSRFKASGFDPLSSDFYYRHVSGLLKQLQGLAWSARGHIRAFSSEDLLLLEGYVEQSIGEQREAYVEQELDAYVAELLEHGGWELGYLRHPEEAGEREIRELLKNWPSEADDRPSLATESDLSEVDALELAIDASLPAVPPFEGKLQHLTDPAASAAVLALMLIADALESFEWHRAGPTQLRGDLIFAGYQAAAENAVHAALAIGLADRLRHEVKVREQLSMEQQEALRQQAKALARERARQSANRKHAPMKQAREWVYSEWLAKAAAFGGNKSDFARVYVGLIRQKFRDSKGDPLAVTDKQVRDVWLRTHATGQGTPL